MEMENYSVVTNTGFSPSGFHGTQASLSPKLQVSSLTTEEQSTTTTTNKNTKHNFTVKTKRRTKPTNELGLLPKNKSKKSRTEKKPIRVVNDSLFIPLQTQVYNLPHHRQLEKHKTHHRGKKPSEQQQKQQKQQKQQYHTSFKGHGMKAQFPTLDVYTPKEAEEIVKAANILCSMSDPTHSSLFYDASKYTSYVTLCGESPRPEPVYTASTDRQFRGDMLVPQEMVYGYEVDAKMSLFQQEGNTEQVIPNDVDLFEMKKVKKPVSSAGKGHRIHSEHFREKAQQLLRESIEFSRVDVADRKVALAALLQVLCSNVTVTTSGKKNPRQFLYDKVRAKRFRTYGEAIRSGALDTLLLQTGSTVLLKSCHTEAEQRFDHLTKGGA